MEVQKLGKVVKDQYETAQQYYKILSVINDLNLAKGEVQLIAFAAIKGNITDKSIREEFCIKYKTTVATINNVVFRMKKKHIIQKTDGKLHINPALTKIDFSQPLALIISVTTPKVIVAPANVEKPQEEISVNLLNVQKYG